MPRKAWYRHLASANRLIVKARDRVEDQRTQILELEQNGRSTHAAAALLYQFEEALRSMVADRAIILSQVRTYRWPAHSKRMRGGVAK